MFISTGIVTYEKDGVHLACDKGLVAYYRSLVPRHITLNFTRFDPHITIIRNELLDKTNWLKYKDVLVTFKYSNEVEWNETYWWLPTESEMFGEIRSSLGLNRNPPWHNGFHLTIGNTK